WPPVRTERLGPLRLSTIEARAQRFQPFPVPVQSGGSGAAAWWRWRSRSKRIKLERELAVVAAESPRAGGVVEQFCLDRPFPHHVTISLYYQLVFVVATLQHFGFKSVQLTILRGRKLLRPLLEGRLNVHVPLRPALRVRGFAGVPLDRDGHALLLLQL